MQYCEEIRLVARIDPREASWAKREARIIEPIRTDWTKIMMMMTKVVKTWFGY